MKKKLGLMAGLFALVSMAHGAVDWQPDPPKVCDACERWNSPHEPFRIFGNTYYVGVSGLSSVLIASDQGLILIDGGLSQSAAQIDANIRKLGFRTEDIQLILSSHAHFDHAGGIAALQRRSSAAVVASAQNAQALERGNVLADDPLFGYGVEFNSFPPVKNVRRIRDNETLRVGELAITAHFTPGHTPGGTTWTWSACEKGQCLNMVYADSLSPVSAPGFRFSGDAKHLSIVDAFRNSIATVAQLPCDILIPAHPEFLNMDEKLKQRRNAPETNPFRDTNACRNYAADATSRLDKRIMEEQ